MARRSWCTACQGRHARPLSQWHTCCLRAGPWKLATLLSRSGTHQRTCHRATKTGCGSLQQQQHPEGNSSRQPRQQQVPSSLTRCSSRVHSSHHQCQASSSSSLQVSSLGSQRRANHLFLAAVHTLRDICTYGQCVRPSNHVASAVCQIGALHWHEHGPRANTCYQPRKQLSQQQGVSVICWVSSGACTASEARKDPKKRQQYRLSCIGSTGHARRSC